MKKQIITFLLIVFTALLTLSAQNIKAVNKNNIKLIKVAVFNGSGAGAISVIETMEALKIDKDISPIEISASDILLGKLQDVDVLIFPGGSGSKQVNNLGNEAVKLVRNFIEEEGKGVVGICAGSYMLTSTKGYPSLKIAHVTHIRDHYDRGRGLIEFKLNKKGLKIFPELEDVNSFAQYYDGPVVIPMKNTKSFNTLGVYVTDIHANKGTPKGITPNKTFIYTEEIGKGKIMAIAGHTESTAGMRWMIPRMARWVSNNKLIKYNEKWIHPKKYDKPILFDSELKSVEKNLWWKLFENDADQKIVAMKKLYNIHSRPAVRWYVGLLRDDNPKVRAFASDLLAKTEYTYAIKDIKASLKVETDKQTKKIMENALEKLDL